MKATERAAQTEKRTGEFTYIFALQNVDTVITKMLYVLTPSATWGWCLGAGTRPPTHLKNSGTPSARVTIVRGTEFWPQTFCARFLVGKGAQVHGSPLGYLVYLAEAAGRELTQAICWQQARLCCMANSPGVSVKKQGCFRVCVWGRN